VVPANAGFPTGQALRDHQAVYASSVRWHAGSRRSCIHLRTERV